MSIEAIKEGIKFVLDIAGKISSVSSSDKTTSKVRLRFEPKNQEMILENIGDNEALNIELVSLYKLISGTTLAKIIKPLYYLIKNKENN